ncbi:MAG: membrane protein insertase YidC [Burkholderiales bacterium]|nr:membrane protein insertase YidC [Burkholderiales bacterium]
MDNKRLVVFIIFSLSVLLLWQKWQGEHNPPVAAQQAQGQAVTPDVKLEEKSLPQSSGAKAVDLATDLQKGQTILVSTDVMQVGIDTIGGDLRRLDLLKYHDSKDPNKPYSFLHSEGGRIYVAQSGLIGSGLPTHKTLYASQSSAYDLKPEADTLQVRLVAPENAGFKVEKIYTFHRGSYIIDVSYEIGNSGTAPLHPYAYFQLLRDGDAPDGDTRFAKTYTGVAVYTDKSKFVKAEFPEIAKGKTNYPTNDNNGWIAMIQHYFVSAWLPEGKVSREYYTRQLGENVYSAGVVLPVGNIEPGKSAKVAVPLYVGPQEQNLLEKLAPGLDLVVDYGWLTIIAKPLFWVLSLFYKWVQNWGVAIILLTVSIKLIFFPLSAASYKSMAKMRAVGPKLQVLKEQYGDDKQRMNQAMMELYKTEKVNPLGGCLPIAVQIPVFIALYTVLLTTVELRNAPFMLWIQDLSLPDPYYVLPLIMGVTMLLQTRMNPTPPDPIQAKVMQIMPVAFSIFFFFFPAGLVLYWLVNNILSISQQWYITRAIEKETSAHAKR